jgi:uncharacterized protein YajQ (UPF0234 family)
LDILRIQLVKRGIDPTVIECNNEALHSGKTFSLQVSFKQGIAPDVSKKLIKLVKEKKLKIQAAVQGDEVRISGKKRDDLQTVMAMVREADLGQPFQFKNFRD